MRSSPIAVVYVWRDTAPVLKLQTYSGGEASKLKSASALVISARTYPKNRKRNDANFLHALYCTRLYCHTALYYCTVRGISWWGAKHVAAKQLRLGLLIKSPTTAANYARTYMMYIQQY